MPYKSITKRREAVKLYDLKPETKAARRAFEATSSRRSMRRAYRLTPAAKAIRLAYNRLPHVKEMHRVYAMRHWRVTVWFLNELKRARGCIDCGETNPIVLHFDHVAKKTFTVSKGIGRRWSDLLAEIRKCEVRCANCHQIITAKRRAR